MKQTKVYTRFKAKQSAGSYSLREIIDNVSRIYNIVPNKFFKQQVALALRRGVSYGILVKCKNKYRYDPETSLLMSLRKVEGKRKRKAKVNKHVRKTESDSKASKEPERVPPRVPRPTVPPPPNLTPKPRNLQTEPFNKVIKHSVMKK